MVRMATWSMLVTIPVSHLRQEGNLQVCATGTLISVSLLSPAPPAKAGQSLLLAFAERLGCAAQSAQVRSAWEHRGGLSLQLRALLLPGRLPAKTRDVTAPQCALEALFFAHNNPGSSWLQFLQCLRCRLL